MSDTSDKLRRWLKKSRSAGEINEMLVDVCREGDLDAVKLLIDAGADVNAREDDEDGKTPLLAACCCYNPDIVRALIEAGADVNAKDEFGRTALDMTRKSDEIREWLKNRS